MREQLMDEISRLKVEMGLKYEQKGETDHEVLRLSRKIDRLINELYKSQQQ